MILYHSLTSPYARKVRVILIEKRLNFEGVNVAESSSRPVTEHNPLGKVPTLVLDDGTALFDSRVISEALEALFPAPRLIPKAPRDRALVRHWEALADGMCDVLIPVVLDARRPPEQRDHAYARKLLGKLRASLDYVEPLVQGREAVADEFSLADIALVSALGYVNLRQPELLEGRDVLTAYVAQQLRRPSLAQTLPPNVPVR
jgi:glutathione S-transferase